MVVTGLLYVYKPQQEKINTATLGLHELPLWSCEIIVPIPLRGIRRRIRSLIWSPNPPFDPYDRAAREGLTERLYESISSKDNKITKPFGTIEYGRLLLKIVEEGFPTPTVATEYFRNLEYLLQTTRKKQESAGQVLLGLGTGRCGSTCLSALLGTIAESCCTHENPPLIFWRPEPEQLQFHMKRLRMLAEYFTFVSDVSHWWLNVIGDFLKEFPDGKVIGLVRDRDDCVGSFMRIRGYGRGSSNNWAPPGNGIWISHTWDPSYPTYPVSKGARKNPVGAKFAMIARYVQDITTAWLS